MEGGIIRMQNVPPEVVSWGPVSGGHPEPGLEAAGGCWMVSSYSRDPGMNRRELGGEEGACVCFQGCHKESPCALWLRNSRYLFHLRSGGQSLKLRCRQGHDPSRDSRGGCFLASSRFGGPRRSLAVAIPLQPLPPSSCGILPGGCVFSSGHLLDLGPSRVTQNSLISRSL